MNYKRFPLGALFTNGYLFWNDANEAFFVDPGGDTRAVQKFITQNNINLKKILLTHGHIDHIAGIHELLPLVGEKIYIGEGDASMLQNPSMELQALLGVHCEGVKDFKTVHDGSIIDFPDIKIKVMETPGHTPGSVCYMLGENILISGDTLFAQSVGRTDLEGGDWLKLENSLKRLDTLSDNIRVLPGHGPETSIGEERELNPYWPR